MIPFWRRVLIITGILIAIALPILVFFLNNPKTTIQPSLLRFLGHQRESPSYSAISETPGYTITLSDTRYLDYITEKFGIFGTQAIVDPRVYHGFPDMKLRHTVTRVQLVLAPTVDSPLVMIPGEQKFVGKSDYQIDGDTLVIRISLDFGELLKQSARPNAFEETFIRASIPIMYYAHGISDGKTNSSTFASIRKEIEDNIFSGLFGWPVRINTK